MGVLLLERRTRQKKFVERRQHKRFGTTFPVSFQIVSRDKMPISRGMFKGRTRDISEGGMCIETRDLDAGWIQFMASGGCTVRLFIEIPWHKAIEAYGRVAWVKVYEEGKYSAYRFGLAYFEVDPLRLAQIMSYGRKARLLPKVSIGLLLVITVFLASTLITVRGHRVRLEARLTEIGEVKGNLDRELAHAVKERESMRIELQSLMSTKNQEKIQLIMLSPADMEETEAMKQGPSEDGDTLKDKLDKALTEKEQLERKLKYTNEEKKLLAQYLAKFRERDGQQKGTPSVQPKRGNGNKKNNGSYESREGVTLKDGSFTEGTVIETTSKGVVLEVKYGKIVVDWEMLAPEDLKKWKP